MFCLPLYMILVLLVLHVTRLKCFSYFLIFFQVLYRIFPLNIFKSHFDFHHCSKSCVVKCVDVTLAVDIRGRVVSRGQRSNIADINVWSVAWLLLIGFDGRIDKPSFDQTVANHTVIFTDSFLFRKSKVTCKILIFFYCTRCYFLAVMKVILRVW